jgi:hypothetical protein
MSYGPILDPTRQPLVDEAIEKVLGGCAGRPESLAGLSRKNNVRQLIEKGYRFLIAPTEREFEAVRIGREATR